LLERRGNRHDNINLAEGVMMRKRMYQLRYVGGNEMRKRTLLTMALLISTLLPALALAGTVEGTIQGLTCVTVGKVCPVDKEDPVIAAERIFVVLVKADEYCLVPNLDRGILARHINQVVRVTGEISPKYKSIKAEKLEVLRDGT
jgi:hypothetical protein